MSTRDDFELKISMEYEHPPCIDRDGDGYADGYVDNAWWGYQKGWQAAMESKDTYDKLEIAMQHAKVSTNPFEFLCNQINAMKNTEFSVRQKEKL
jgi:hypothetical protein